MRQRGSHSNDGIGVCHAAKAAETERTAGLSSERLQRITDYVSADVERGAIPGLVLAVARGGRVGYAEAIGYRDREANASMALDSIFRIASMTKPMVSVTAMQLAEEGRLDIGAPVAQYVPEFGAMTVGPERKPAARTMTVQDLLRHTSGLTYAAFGDSPVQMIWRDANLQDEGQTNAELVAKLGQLPLMTEPGTTWEYSMSTDVLGRVVEAVEPGKASPTRSPSASSACSAWSTPRSRRPATKPAASPSRLPTRRPARSRRCAT